MLIKLNTEIRSKYPNYVLHVNIFENNFAYTSTFHLSICEFPASNFTILVIKRTPATVVSSKQQWKQWG